MILLIQPKIGRYDKLGIRIPIGLLYTATYLKKHSISSRIIDTRVNNKWKKELFQKLKETDLIGISCMMGPQVKEAIKIAKAIKTKKPNALIVLGGVHPTSLPEQALKKSCIDVVVRGEGEKPFLELAKKRPLSDIKGISFKRIINSQEKIIHNPVQELLKPEEIPLPDYTFLDMNKYSSMTYAGEKGFCIQWSRGCPYKCGFCYSGSFNRGVWRPFPVDNVLKNIDILVKEYGAKTLYIVDDNVAVNQKRFLEILKKIKQKPYKINLGFQGLRIDTLERFTDEIYTLLHESGVKSIDIGIETLNESLLKKVDKNLTHDQILRTLEKVEKQNFSLKFNFVAGLPGQTKEEIDYDVQEAKKLVKKHKNSYILYNIYTPFPGTKLYEEALKKGFKPVNDFEKWSGFAGTSWMRKYSWFPKKTRKYLEDISFLFMFSNKNILIKVSNKYARIIAKIYQPIARFRLKYNFHFFMIERKLAEFLD